MLKPAGGGEGMGAIEKTLQALDDRVGGGCQVVAVCGRNKALIQRLNHRCDRLLNSADCGTGTPKSDLPARPAYCKYLS